MRLTGHRLAYFTGYLISLIGSLAVLFLLYFIVIPDCARVAVQSGGSASCTMNMPVIYLFSLVFAVVIVYSGYRLVRIAQEE